VLAVGMLLFHVKVNGSLLLVAIVAVVGAGCFVSLGFAIAAVSKNQEVAQALMNVVQTPMMFLSCIFFPMDTQPRRGSSPWSRCCRSRISPTPCAP